MLRRGIAAIKHEVDGFVDLLFPPACLICLGPLTDHEQECCPHCRSSIMPLPLGCCSRCALPFESVNSSRHLCVNCLTHLPTFSAVSAVGLYEGALKTGLRRFKYQGAVELQTLFGRMLLDCCPTLSGDEIIVPVPMHPRRLRQRSFNQSLLLAKYLARKLLISIDCSLLQRVVDNHSQQGLSARERHRNLTGAFLAKAPLTAKKIVLIDDVMTTGATVGVCSKALIDAGATEVQVVVVARAPRH